MSPRHPPGATGRADSGFTLVEVLFAIVLSSMIVGVVAAALVTSLTVARSTTDQVGDSTDAGLISSFLLRDAQSAGATDPTTGLLDTSLGTLGVTTNQAAAGWSTCSKPTTFVVRFAWIDPIDRTRPVVVYYFLDGAQAQLTRRVCKAGETVDVVVGSNLTSAVASCAPACEGAPTTVSLKLAGSGTRAPFSYTLRASLRDDTQAMPTVANSPAIPLLTLGATCPNLTLTGTGPIMVRGSVLSSCVGALPISGDPAVLQPTGTTSAITGTNDPFRARVAPTDSCASGGANPAAIGLSATRDSVVVYPQKVVLAADTVFAAGRYVFCQGLEITGGRITGADMLFYVKTGTVTVDAAATVDLAGRTTGVEANLLLWVAAPSAIRIDSGVHASSLRGLIYAPTSTLQLSSVIGANVGGVVVNAMGISGAGAARIGLPLPALSVLPSTVPLGEVGVPYVGATLAAAGGTSPYTWSAAGLPAGLTIDPLTGVITGTATAAASAVVAVVTVADATAQTASFDVPVTINAVTSVVWPALPPGEVGVVYPPTTMAATLGTPPYTWSATGLPAGLSINASTGVVSGSPTVAGSFPVVVTVTGALGGTATQSYPLVINAALSASWPTLPTGQVAVPYPATTMTATLGTAPYAWSATGLPAGVSIDAATGTVAGTPTVAGTFTVVAKVVDALGATLTKSSTVTVNPALGATWPVLSNGQVAVAYPAISISATGGTTPYTWTATGLPPGLVISAATGTVSGTPSTANVYAVTLRVTDARGATLSQAYTVTITAASGVCPGSFAGWRGEYFANISFTAPATVCRDDASINFDWGGGAPVTGVAADNFSVRWTKTEDFAAGTYTFTMGSDDGSRLYIDGVLVLNSWTDHAYPGTPPKVAVSISEGSHTLVMEYYEKGGSARATLAWAATTPASCMGTAAGWFGQYFNDMALTSPPAACRDDAAINFDWTSGAPLTGMAVDDFSVRWTRTQTFTAGAYDFALGTDDGGRLYIDGVLVLDRWVDQGYPTPQPNVVRAISQGAHTLVVEYYERGGDARATLVITPLSPPTTPTLAFSAFTNTYWSGPGSNVVHYRSTATSGAFTTTASATDAASGIASYAFPALGANWTSTPGAVGVNTYSWTTGPAAPGTQNVTATNGAGVASAAASFTLTDDITAPTAGTVAYPDATTAASSVSVSFTTGTDAGSGIANRLLQRQSATLSGSTCGGFGAFTTVANGTNPTSPVVDAIDLGQCYRYQYVTTDNVGNVDTAVGAGVVKVRKSYVDTVNGSTGLVSYWRLGEAATSPGLFSSDTFGGTTGGNLQGHIGEVGATWTKHAFSEANAVLTAGNRIRKGGSKTYGALYYSSGVPTSADYTVQADVFVASSLTNDVIGVVGRLNAGSSSATFYAAVYDLPSQKWTLYAIVAGNRIQLGQTDVMRLSVGSTYRLALEMKGSTIRLLVDGAQQLSVTDTRITAAGRAGVVMGYAQDNTTSDTAGMQLDNFTAAHAVTTTALVDAKGVNTGSYPEAPTLAVPGAIVGDTNTAALFDGSNDYGTVARQISGDLSIELWFASTTGGVGTGSQWWQGAGLVDAEVNGAFADFGVSLRSDGKVVAGVGTPDVSIVSPLGYRDGNWHHVVFTRTRASGAMVLYVDGAPVASGTGSTALLSAAPAITFGRIQAGGNFFAGSLDEIAVYDAVLPPAVVAAHFDASK